MTDASPKSKYAHLCNLFVTAALTPVDRGMDQSNDSQEAGELSSMTSLVASTMRHYAKRSFADALLYVPIPAVRKLAESMIDDSTLALAETFARRMSEKDGVGRSARYVPQDMLTRQAEHFARQNNMPCLARLIEIARGQKDLTAPMVR